MISERKLDDIPPQMKILNMIIPILMHFCSYVSNSSIESHIKLHVIQQYVTSNYFQQYKYLTLSNQTSCYKIKCIRIQQRTTNIVTSFK